MYPAAILTKASNHLPAEVGRGALTDPAPVGSETFWRICAQQDGEESGAPQGSPVPDPQERDGDMMVDVGFAPPWIAPELRPLAVVTTAFAAADAEASGEAAAPSENIAAIGQAMAPLPPETEAKCEAELGQNTDVISPTRPLVSAAAILASTLEDAATAEVGAPDLGLGQVKTPTSTFEATAGLFSAPNHSVTRETTAVGRDQLPLPRSVVGQEAAPETLQMADAPIESAGSPAMVSLKQMQTPAPVPNDLVAAGDQPKLIRLDAIDAAFATKTDDLPQQPLTTPANFRGLGGAQLVPITSRHWFDMVEGASNVQLDAQTAVVAAAPQLPLPNHSGFATHLIADTSVLQAAHGPLAKLIVTHAQARPDDTLDVQMAPIELGHLRLKMQVSNDAVHVVIMAERGDTLDLLRRNSEQLLQEFKQSGYAHASLSFGQWGGRGGNAAPPPPLTTPASLSDEIGPALAPPASAAVRQHIGGGIDLRF